MKFYLFFIPLLFLSCKKESIQEPVSTNSDSNNQSTIHEALFSYFVTFEDEARERGLSFADELLSLETHIADIPENGVAGQCSWSSNNPNQVTIDLPFWNNADLDEREWVVFHELGHCVLNRGHTEAQTQEGICLSIMASGTGNCRTLYNTQNREYYLNELFAALD